MDQHPFDDTATDALLDGKVSPAQAPDGLQHVAALIHLAQAPATTDRAAERQVVSQMGAIVRGGGSGAAATSRFAAHRARLATVAAVAGLVALSGGAVAAAAGALPNPVQRVVASGFSNVGISMPDPTTGARPTTTTAAPPTTTRHHPATPAGLCVAYLAASKNPTAAANQARATAFVRLAEAAKAHHESVATYCTDVLAARKPTHAAPPTSVPGKGTDTGKGKPEDPSGTHHPSSPPPPGKGHDSGSDGHHSKPTTVPGGSSHDGGGSGSGDGSSGHSSGSGGDSSGSSGHH
jgi:uncharacterized membrane protein YgcG